MSYKKRIQQLFKFNNPFVIVFTALFTLIIILAYLNSPFILVAFFLLIICIFMMIKYNDNLNGNAILKDQKFITFLDTLVKDGLFIEILHEDGSLNQNCLAFKLICKYLDEHNQFLTKNTLEITINLYIEML